MKKLDMTPEAAEKFAALLLRGLGEIHGRHLSQATGLETLGVLATRLLVGGQQLTLEDLATEVVNQCVKQELPVSLNALRESVMTLYGCTDELTKIGFTFHTVQ